MLIEDFYLAFNFLKLFSFIKDDSDKTSEWDKGKTSLQSVEFNIQT